MGRHELLLLSQMTNSIFIFVIPQIQESVPTAIQAPEFLSHPKYRYFGDVDTRQGNLLGTYQFTPVGHETSEMCE